MPKMNRRLDECIWTVFDAEDVRIYVLFAHAESKKSHTYGFGIGEENGMPLAGSAGAVKEQWGTGQRRGALTFSQCTRQLKPSVQSRHGDFIHT